MSNYRHGAAVLLCSLAAIFMMALGAAAQEKTDKNAQFCEDFFQNVIVGGKVDEASKYLTDDFIEHNVRLTANGLPEFKQKVTAMHAAQGARAGGGANRPPRQLTVFSHDDVVVFISTPIPAGPNPNNPGKEIAASTHFDVYRLRNGKIAEHWD